MIRYNILLLLFLFPSFLHAQCQVKNNAFKPGEFVSYTITYNWGPVWVDAGVVTFSVDSVLYREKPAFHIKSSGKTFPSYDLLFKVRDYYDSWVDPVTFKTIDFKRYVYEGGYSLVNTLHFDYAQNKVISNTKTNNNPVRFDTLPVRPCAFDMLAAIYQTRNIDLSGVNTGNKQHVTVLIDDAYYDIYIRPLSKEVIETQQGSKYRCIKFAAKMVQGTIFKGEEDVLVWVTDDANRVPVYIEAKIIVGTIKAYIREVKGLRNPENSLVK